MNLESSRCQVGCGLIGAACMRLETNGVFSIGGSRRLRLATAAIELVIVVNKTSADDGLQRDASAHITSPTAIGIRPESDR